MGRFTPPSYLVRNDYSYCFRVVIPPDLRQIIRLREIRYSLHTGSLSVAKYRSLLLSAKVQGLFRYLRERRDVGEKPFDAAKIRDFIRDELRSIESIEEDEKLAGCTRQQHEGSIFLNKLLLEQRKDELARGDFSNIRKHVDEIISNHEMWAWHEDRNYRQLCLDVLKLEVECLERSLNHLDGNYSDERSTIVVAASPIQHEQPSEQLTAVIKKYISEKSQTVTRKTLEEYEKCLGLMVEVVGDMAIRKVDRTTFREYKEKLQLLPSNMRKKAQYRDKSLSEILEMSVPESDRFNYQNVNKYIIRASNVRLGLCIRGV